MAYEWLGEVLMAGAEQLGGLSALTALLVGLSATLLLLLYAYAYQRSRNVKAAFVACALLLPVASVFFTLRPQLVGYIFLLLTLLALEAYRNGRRAAVWFLPAVFLLWVNTHGSFVFGLLAMGIYWASGLRRFRWGGLVAEAWSRKQRRELLCGLLLCVIALTATPYGTRLAAYPLELALLQPTNVASIQEWQPLSFNLVVGKIFLVLLLLFLLLQLGSRQDLRLEEVALLFFAVYAACVHIRFLFLFVLVFAPLLAGMFERWIPAYQPAKDRPWLNGTLLALVGGGLLAFFPSSSELDQMVARNYPRDAVAYLREHPVETLFNEYGWGGYLIWSASPAHRVFIDGRADIYEYSGVLTDYLRITRLDPDTLGLLRKYGVEACLLGREAPLGTLLEALPDWKRVYSDELSNLFVHGSRLQPGPLQGGAPSGALGVAAELLKPSGAARARQRPPAVP
jgi:hypothetical protein